MLVGAIFDSWVARLRTCNAVSHALPHSRRVIHLALGRPEKGVSQRATSEAKEPRAKSRRQKTSERRRVASWACGGERMCGDSATSCGGVGGGRRRGRPYYSWLRCLHTFTARKSINTRIRTYASNCACATRYSIPKMRIKIISVTYS